MEKKIYETAEMEIIQVEMEVVVTNSSEMIKNSIGENLE